jgi:hypothetical protein
MNWGLGRHAVTLQQEQVVMVLKIRFHNRVSWTFLVCILIRTPLSQLLFAFECVHVLGIACVKLVFLWMYMRIFPLGNFKNVTYIVGSITIAWAIAIILFSIFQCTPIRKAWLGPSIPGHCGNLKASFIGNGTKARKNYQNILLTC